MLHSKPIVGTVRGNSILFENPLNIPDGVRVEIIVRSGPLSEEEQAEKLRELFGSCEGDAANLDEFIKWNDELRKRNRSELGQ